MFINILTKYNLVKHKFPIKESEESSTFNIFNTYCIKFISIFIDKINIDYICKWNSKKKKNNRKLYKLNDFKYTIKNFLEYIISELQEGNYKKLSSIPVLYHVLNNKFKFSSQWNKCYIKLITFIIH